MIDLPIISEFRLFAWTKNKYSRKYTLLKLILKKYFLTIHKTMYNLF
jgi:hypothetical protein